MKKVIIMIGELLLTATVVLFGIWFFYAGEINGATGIYEIVGSLYSGFSENQMESSGMDLLNTLSDAAPPKIRYVGGIRKVGQVVPMKELFEVQLTEDGEYKPGVSEDGFSLSFVTITSLSGNRAVEVLSTDAIAAMEEIPSSFVYDSDLDLLYFFHSGTYRISVRIFNEDGKDVVYDIIFPVEVEGGRHEKCNIWYF